MEEWNDKELYYFFTIEATLADDPTLETLNKHLKQYEHEQEYLACAGIKLGIEFAKFNKLLTLTKQIQDAKGTN